MSIKVHLNKGLGFYFCGRIALYPAEHVVGYPKELDINTLTDNEILGLEHGSNVGAIRIVEGYEELLAKAKQLKGEVEEEPNVEESKVEEVEPVKEDKTEEVVNTETEAEEDTSEQSDEVTEEDKTKPATTRRRTKRTTTK